MRQPQSTLFLARDVFACPTKRHWVFLDVRRDKYLCLKRVEFDSLRIPRHGLHHIREDRADEPPPLPADLISLRIELLNAGILTADPEHSQEIASVSIPIPSPTPLALPCSQTKSGLTGGLPAFLYACWKADRALRRNPFHKTIEDLIRRKQRVPPIRQAPAHPHDLSRTISVFNSLRPLYPKPYLCLFDSLALLEMLALYGAFPALVFGVTTDPFQAHCWLQMENIVLNDSPATVRAYTPIMRV
jgi:hypothetical protein